MNENEQNAISLEASLVDTKLDESEKEQMAFEEESNNARENYAYFDARLAEEQAKITFSDTGRFDTGIDYEDIDMVQWKKGVNKRHWEECDKLKAYCDAKQLYIGHVHMDHGSDYFMIDSAQIPTTFMYDNKENKKILINVDDKRYSDYIKSWRYPNTNKHVSYSRNISMYCRQVTDVDIVLDRSDSLRANITDSYLRKALIRNKNRDGIQSIIQTIQEKQDAIRLLPKEMSFIVQGCAGSGKTMVLLHRLRYLIFNREIFDDEYIFLVPGFRFKKYIEDISLKFRIDIRNILPYAEYYRMLCGRVADKTETDTDELVFAPDYLERVYSEQFMKECYSSLFQMLADQMNGLICFCENKLNSFIEKERSDIDAKLEELRSFEILEARRLTEKMKDSVSVDITDNVDSVTDFYNAALTIYKDKKSQLENAIEMVEEIMISEDDRRILDNADIIKIKAKIVNEEEMVKKASKFTALAHKRKLDMLMSEYDEIRESIKRELIEKDRKRNIGLADAQRTVFEGITMEEADYIFSELNTLIDLTKEKMDSVIEISRHIEEGLSKKYASEIKWLNETINLSADLKQDCRTFIEFLKPAIKFFQAEIETGSKLYAEFEKHILDNKEMKKFSNEFKMFAQRTPQQLQIYMNTLLFNICKKRVLDEYKVKIHDSYKHYWYMNLYSRYLTREMGKQASRYIYIDEAQDLSLSEVNLIYKINTVKENDTVVCYPTMNMFGDMRQMISSYGISKWSNIEYISMIIKLEENFRNTNQIIDYCNLSLPFTMQKIGVDMEEVAEYDTLQDAIKKTHEIINKPTIIAKDDYAVEDVRALLADTPIVESQIFTVKMVKGLEFREVYVFDRGMTSNEKYIAYTRALNKLNVIHKLPNVTDKSQSLIVQGNDEVE